MSSVFISYRRDDESGHAGRLHDDLGERLGPDRLFIDVDALEPVVDFVEAIERALGASAVLLAVIGRRWLEAADAHGRRRLDNPDDFVRLEVATALARGVRVIPVLVQGATVPAAEHLPEPLRPLVRRHAIELSDERWDYDVGRLVGAMERVLGERALPPTRPPQTSHPGPATDPPPPPAGGFGRHPPCSIPSCSGSS